MSTDSGSRRTRTVGEALGLGSLSDGEPGLDPQLLRDLYRHARNEDGGRVLLPADHTFRGGWVNLDSQRAFALISAFVPLDDTDDRKQARKTAQRNLEAVGWNDVLGIEDPPIRAKVKIHGRRWGIKFQSAERVARGQERRNESLPPIPKTAQDDTDDGDAPERGNDESDASTDGASDEDPQSVLRKGGMQ